MKIINFAAALLLFATSGISAQTIGYDEFIVKVRDNNIGYLTEKFNIDIATANVQAARVFNDPEISFAYSNNQDWSLQMGQGYEAELSYNFSLGGVRHARIEVARSEKEVTEAAVEDYFRNLHAEATACWLDAWRKKQTAALMYSSYEQMDNLARGDSLRYATGEINETDAMQSRLEARTMYNDYLQSRTAYLNALSTLAVYMGGQALTDIEEMPQLPPLQHPLAELLAAAEDNRADLRAAERTKTLSERNLRLVRASRAPELGLSAGYAYNKEVRNEIAPAPAFNGFTVGVSVPLKFSSLNRAEKRAAQYTLQQSEAAYHAAMLEIRSEVIQAYNDLLTAREVLQRYDSSMLADAERILKNKTFGYERGETGLLEVLTARRTFNDVFQGLIDARYAEQAAAVGLRHAIGIWE